MTILHLCRRWAETQGRRKIERGKRSVTHRLLLYEDHLEDAERLWLEVIVCAVGDLYCTAPLDHLDDTGGRRRACSDPLYFFDGRLRNHADMVGCFAAEHVLRLMKNAGLFPESVWDRISY